MEQEDKGFLITESLSKYHQETKALRRVNLVVRQGEWVSVMGPSGSGKTTLLSLIGGLVHPTEGKILIEGVELSSLNDYELARFRREKIGLIFQQHYLISYLTALENVMLAQFFHSLPDEREAAEALKRIGLGHRLRHLPSQLSGGEQQRVCIARALINSPLLLLADEPTGNLDRENALAVLQDLKRLHREDHFTILLVTHDPWVAQWAERLVSLDNGRVVGEEKIKSMSGEKWGSKE